MNNLAPRQGIFAIILLVSFCLHIVMLMFSTEKQQFDHRTSKGEAIVAQLSKEATVALANQDRISLSVLANRYQVDDEVAKLVITDQNNQNLVQTGQSQPEIGQVIDEPIIQNNRTLGHVIVTMKAISKGEIVASQWLFILGSAILHGFLWLIYRYVARPTTQQLAEIGERVQQRIVLARGQTRATIPLATDTTEATSNLEPTNSTDGSPNMGKSIQDFLQQQRQSAGANNPDDSNHSDTLHSTDQDNIDSLHTEDINQTTNAATAQSANVLPTTNFDKPENANTVTLDLHIHFYDEFGLLGRVAPEIGKPYLRLCEDLLKRVTERLFDTSYRNKLHRFIRDVKVDTISDFTEQGAIIQLQGRSEQVVLASILLAKLVIILNQVVYEKHRELSRFALPMMVGVGLSQQFDEVERLVHNHYRQDSLFLLLPDFLLKALAGKVTYTPLAHPTSLSEREMVWYTGLTEQYMLELISKRDEILTASMPAS